MITGLQCHRFEFELIDVPLSTKTVQHCSRFSVRSNCTVSSHQIGYCLCHYWMCCPNQSRPNGSQNCFRTSSHSTSRQSVDGVKKKLWIEWVVVSQWTNWIWQKSISFTKCVLRTREFRDVASKWPQWHIMTDAEHSKCEATAMQKTRHAKIYSNTPTLGMRFSFDFAID